ncbi:ATP-binding cassette domain-containing protein [Firmicutes bacterium AM59-13]|nr:ATP-binding cassette domain-containing protein [Firmicutes bacterium AM59-13]
MKKGESVAFIGESGAGKTTLADIILGLYIPQEGTVTVDGVSIYDIPQDWSRIVGYVPQSVYLLDDTIRNNILFGEKQMDDKKIWDALKQAQLYDFVKTLPDGLNTIVGERGIKFSGGQRQRIAIARALYYNPDILVLDEATSALDNETEEALMESIEALQGLKTLIIIAHRLSTIRNCDKIYEVKDGKIELRNKEEILKGI